MRQKPNFYYHPVATIGHHSLGFGIKIRTHRSVPYPRCEQESCPAGMFFAALLGVDRVGQRGADMDGQQ